MILAGLKAYAPIDPLALENARGLEHHEVMKHSNRCIRAALAASVLGCISLASPTPASSMDMQEHLDPLKPSAPTTFVAANTFGLNTAHLDIGYPTHVYHFLNTPFGAGVRALDPALFGKVERLVNNPAAYNRALALIHPIMEALLRTHVDLAQSDKALASWQIDALRSDYETAKQKAIRELTVNAAQPAEFREELAHDSSLTTLKAWEEKEAALAVLACFDDQFETLYQDVVAHVRNIRTLRVTDYVNRQTVLLGDANVQEEDADLASHILDMNRVAFARNDHDKGLAANKLAWTYAGIDAKPIITPNHGEALAHAEEAVRLLPNNVEALRVLAHLRAFGTGVRRDQTRALIHLLWAEHFEAQAEQPDMDAARTDLEWLLERMGNSSWWRIRQAYRIDPALKQIESPTIQAARMGTNAATNQSSLSQKVILRRLLGAAASGAVYYAGEQHLLRPILTSPLLAPSAAILMALGLIGALLKSRTRNTRLRTVAVGLIGLLSIYIVPQFPYIQAIVEHQTNTDIRNYNSYVNSEKEDRKVHRLPPPEMNYKETVADILKHNIPAVDGIHTGELTPGQFPNIYNHINSRIERSVRPTVLFINGTNYRLWLDVIDPTRPLGTITTHGRFWIRAISNHTTENEGRKVLFEYQPGKGDLFWNSTKPFQGITSVYELQIFLAR